MKNTKIIATVIAGLGATAALAGIGAGTATAHTAGVADGCYEVTAVATPGALTGVRVGTAHVDGDSITVLGHRGTVTATPSGGVAHVAGVKARLTESRIGEPGDWVTFYRVSGVPGVPAGVLMPSC